MILVFFIQWFLSVIYYQHCACMHFVYFQPCFFLILLVSFWSGQWFSKCCLAFCRQVLCLVSLWMSLSTSQSSFVMTLFFHLNKFSAIKWIFYHVCFAFFHVDFLPRVLCVFSCGFSTTCVVRFSMWICDFHVLSTMVKTGTLVPHCSWHWHYMPCI